LKLPVFCTLKLPVLSEPVRLTFCDADFVVGAGFLGVFVIGFCAGF
jgi:hypothetical protein